MEEKKMTVAERSLALHYEKKGKMKEVDGTVDMNDVFKAITDILGE